VITDWAPSRAGVLPVTRCKFMCAAMLSQRRKVRWGCGSTSVCTLGFRSLKKKCWTLDYQSINNWLKVSQFISPLP